MSKQKKILALSSVLTVYFSTAAAQGIAGGGGIGQNPGDILINIVSFLTIAEPNNNVQAIAILAAILALYAITKNLVEQIFVRLEEDILSDGNYSRKLTEGDSYPTGTKLVSFAIAYITVNVLKGMLGISVWALGAVAIIGLAIVLMKAFGFLGAATPTGKAGSAGKKGIDAIRNMREDVEEKEKEVEGEEKDLKNKEDETEAEEGQGQDAGTVEKEVEAEEREFEDIVQKIEAIEQEMEELLSEVKEEEEIILRQEKKEEQELEEVQNIEKNAFKDLQKVLNDVRNRAGNIGPDIPQLEQDVNAQVQELEELKDSLKVEAEVHTEINELVQELQRIKNQDIPELAEEIEQAEVEEQGLEDEEKKEEKIAEKQGDKEDYERDKKTEKRTQKAKQELKEAEQKLNQLETEVNEEIQQLKNEKQTEEQELQEINEILQELGQEENLVEKVRNNIRGNRESFDAESSEKLWNDLTKLEELIEEVRQEGETLLNQISNS